MFEYYLLKYGPMVVVAAVLWVVVLGLLMPLFVFKIRNQVVRGVRLLERIDAALSAGREQREIDIEREELIKAIRARRGGRAA